MATKIVKCPLCGNKFYFEGLTFDDAYRLTRHLRNQHGFQFGQANHWDEIVPHLIQAIEQDDFDRFVREQFILEALK